MSRPIDLIRLLCTGLVCAAVAATSACASKAVTTDSSAGTNSSALGAAPASAAPVAGSAGSTAPAPSAGSGPSGTGSPSPSTATAALALAHRGVTGPLPTEAVKPKSGVNYWVISCGQRVTTCSSTSAGAVEAATKIGWQTHVCDGQLNPAGISSCIRQAIAAKAGALQVIGTDCAPIKGALAEANKAGIKTIGGGGFDCSETGGDRVFSGFIKYQVQFSNHQWWAQIGKLQADWLIGATNGQAKVLSVKFTDEAWGEDIQNAFIAELKTCGGCSIVKTQEMSNGDVGDGSLRTKFSTALLQASTANAVNVPIDGWFSAGLAQAVTSSGRAANLKVIGSIGEIPNVDYIRTSGGENATAAFSGENSGWAGVDVAVRLLAGKSAPADGFPEGVAIQVVDKTANLPAAGSAYQPPVDYRAAYLKLWGVS